MKNKKGNKVKITKMTRCGKLKAILEIELKYIFGKIEYKKIKS